MPLSEGAVKPAVLEDVKRRIRRCPFPIVSEAIMRINGEFIQSDDYKLCLNALLSGGFLEAREVGFLINRRLLPREEVVSVLDIPLVSAHPVARRETPAPPAIAVKVRVSEPPPPQWELF
jgi:hypothetical protein